MGFLGTVTHGSSDRTPRVLLIHPPVRLTFPPRLPPMGLLYLAAVLEKAGAEVEILDLNLMRRPIDVVLDEVDARDFDVVGIGGMTTVYYYIKLVSLLLKERYAGLPIIGGGSACSASADTVLANTGVDVVCIGEGEPIIAELCDRLAHGEPIANIPGLAFRTSDGQVVHSPPRRRFQHWAALIPAHHLVDMEAYIRNNAVKYGEMPGLAEHAATLGVDLRKASRPVHVFSKRGCPFGCTFCYRNFGREVVYASPEHVVAYLDFLSERYDTAHFVFGDELFNVDHRWVTRFCNLIISSGRKYVMSTSNGLRANCITRERLQHMKDAGF